MTAARPSSQAPYKQLPRINRERNPTATTTIIIIPAAFKPPPGSLLDM